MLNVRTVLLASMIFTSSYASADAGSAKIFGVTLPVMSDHPGAFRPAGTNLACGAIQDGWCWDGQKWIAIYPVGPRKYSTNPPERVACVAIVQPENDCWDGREWYRLPPGKLFGVVASPMSETPGAFLIAPLR